MSNITLKSQKDINSTIDALFDEFIKADCDINKMNPIEEPNNQFDEINETKLNKTHFVDQSNTLDVTNSFSGNLMNNYIEYFKKKTKKPQNFTMLDGIDKDDPYSTNMPLEELYFEMTTFLENEKEHPELCKIVPYNEMDQQVVAGDELYCILANGKPLVVSQSLFALLIELTNIKNENKNKIIYDIVNLK